MLLTCLLLSTPWPGGPPDACNSLAPALAACSLAPSLHPQAEARVSVLCFTGAMPPSAWRPTRAPTVFMMMSKGLCVAGLQGFGVGYNLSSLAPSTQWILLFPIGVCSQRCLQISFCETFPLPGRTLPPSVRSVRVCAGTYTYTYTRAHTYYLMLMCGLPPFRDYNFQEEFPDDPQPSGTTIPPHTKHTGSV